MLKRYLDSGSSADFERIVRANGSLVFGVALRSTRSRVLAEEVTQEVFITLARKASSIREPQKLAGWLHRTALYHAANINRREMRRRRAMESYSREPSTEIEGAAPGWDEAAWQQAVPILDHAIDGLSETDRETVMQRFFEGRSFKQISDATGKSEDASRKQLGRALEKLARSLKSKGVTIPVSALGVGLGIAFTRSALPITPAQLTQVAIAAKPSLIAQTLVAMSSYKLTIAAAAIAAMIPVGIELLNGTNLEVASNMALSPGSSSEEKQPASAQTGLPPAESGVSPRSQEELHAAMAEIFALKNPMRVTAKIDHLMMGLGDDELESALTALQLFDVDPPIRQLYHAKSQLFIRWASFDPHGAFEVATRISDGTHQQSALIGVAQGWVEHDLEGLDEFITSLPYGGQRDLLDYWRWETQSRRDPVAAGEAALKIGDPDRQARLLGSIARYLGREDPEGGIALLAKVEDSVTKQGWLDSILTDWSRENPAEAFAQSLRVLGEEQQGSTIPRIMENWAQTDPAGAFEAVLALPESARSSIVLEMLGSGIADLSVVAPQLAQLNDPKERSALVAGVADGLSDRRHDFVNVTPEDVELVRELVEAMPAGEDRFSARWDLASAWATIDFDSSNEWYRSQPGVKQSMKEKFVKFRKP